MKTENTKWVERFGTLTRAEKREGKKGPFVSFTVDCGKFKQAGLAFQEGVQEEILATEIGSRVWMFGPVDQEGENRRFTAIRIKAGATKPVEGVEEEVAA